MLGYHYTTDLAWASIKKQGLVPQLMKRSPFTGPTCVKIPDKIIWLFTEPARDELDTRGQILFTLITKSVEANYVLELQVEYTRQHLAPVYRTLAPGSTLDITHVGSLSSELGGRRDEPMRYHQDKHSVILTRRVKPSCIYISRAWKMFVPVLYGR